MASEQDFLNSIRPVAQSTIRGDRDIAPSRFDAKDTQSFDDARLEQGVVMSVDYEKFTVSIRAMATDYLHVPIPLTFAGAGRRHFLGAMPEIGDVCLLGWGAQQSGATRQPMIVGWLLPGVMAGQDWLPMQEHSPDEWGYSPTERLQWEGIADRTRFKLRHMQPGNIMASSSQGADLVLDESARMMNRRGNEINLRDQDQAIIFRSLQQFHAGAGFRVYSGMVQRDAQLLPTSMVSDGVDWAAAQQLDAEGNPLPVSELAASSVKKGYLTPNAVFDQTLEAGIANGVDPYYFLQNALLIDDKGRVTAKTTADAVYNGKSIYRVSQDGSNPSTDPQSKSLTEYRIELTHTTDGSLPVTEQTDGFDADRLPSNIPRDTSELNSKTPYLEFVLGSVVGNDPFSIPNKPLYGIPLKPVGFSGDQRTPGLVSGINAPMTEHAAFLFKVKSPFDTNAQPSFVSFSKDGKMFLSTTSTGSYSAEWLFGSGVRLGVGKEANGKSWSMEADGQISLKSLTGDNQTNRGIEIVSDKGAVRIFGGQSETVGGISQRANPTGSGLPGVTVESATNLLLKGSKGITLSSPLVSFQNVAQMNYSTTSSFLVNSGDAVSISSKVYSINTVGNMNETFGGPRDGDSSNGPLRNTQFVGTASTGVTGGVVDQYAVEYGDREETFKQGSHTTTSKVGNLTYQTEDGYWKARAGENTTVLDSDDGLDTKIKKGDYTINVSSGAVTVTASKRVKITSQGTIAMDGNRILMRANTGKTGGIVSQADIDPISGRTLGTLGLGSVGHRISVG